MANLTNCSTCGSRERPSDLSLFAGRYVCPDCADDYFDLFDHPQHALDYIASLPVAPPRDLWGKPMEVAS